MEKESDETSRRDGVPDEMGSRRDGVPDEMGSRRDGVSDETVVTLKCVSK